MKNLFLAVCGFVIASGAFAEKYEIKLDWNKSATLSDNVVQMCDDTYYSSIDVIIPGKARQDFFIEMAVDIASGHASEGCSIKKTESNGKTRYSFSVDSSCTIRVYEAKRINGQKQRVAEYELSDAC